MVLMGVGADNAVQADEGHFRFLCPQSSLKDGPLHHHLLSAIICQKYAELFGCDPMEAQPS